MTKPRLIVAGAGILVLVFIIILFLTGLNKPRVAPTLQMTLEVWGIFQDRGQMNALGEDFNKLFPNVQINYRSFGDAEFEDYEPEVVRALAEGKGPDIFFINNTWVPRHLGKLAPAPRSILSADKLRERFVDVVANDFVYQDKEGVERVYGAPLSLDTLALFYNKEMLNSAGITMPPQTWTEFREAIRKLRVIGDNGEVKRAGAAIGTVENVHRSTDILSLLMLQNGSPIVDKAKGRALLTSTFASAAGNRQPGSEALNFYTKFADPKSDYYTWNRRLHYSVDAFYGQVEIPTAMIFDYSYMLDTISRKAPYLDFGIAPAPQINTGPGQDQVNYANYWAPVVTKRTVNRFHDSYRTKGYDGCNGPIDKAGIPAGPCWYAWQFINFLNFGGNGLLDDPNLSVAKNYLKQTNRPAAQRALIDWQRTNFPQRLSIFADQGLTAKSWHQPDSRLTEEYLANAINDVLLRNVSPAAALRDAENRINALFSKQ